MFRAVTFLSFFLAVRWGAFREGRFLGRIVDEWIFDSQEFIHLKLPRLIVIAAIAFFLNKILRVITRRMVHVAEAHAAGAGGLRKCARSPA
jgi:hypothetical protein